ncbi:hypothetical protein Pelo_3972 [Pelomyxa schiedti]|nr:hypothetical protein Pelo_3972 [Pelomyxa schiedti]
MKAAKKVLKSAVKQRVWEMKVASAEKLTQRGLYEEALETRRWKLGNDDPRHICREELETEASPERDYEDDFHLRKCDYDDDRLQEL